MSSPAKGRWARVGTVVRRSTSLLASSRSPTPANEDSSDAVSIKSNKSTSKSIKSILGVGSDRGNGKKGSVQVDTTNEAVANPAVAGLMLPSAIAESPDREAFETTAAATLGPSPLAQQGSTEPTFAAEPEEYVEDDANQARRTMMSDEMTSEPEPVSGVESATGSTPSPTGYVPPPLLDSSAGNPGAFTDDPDSLPQPLVIQDPYASRSQVNLGAEGKPLQDVTPVERDLSKDGSENSGPTPGFVAAVEENSKISPVYRSREPDDGYGSQGASSKAAEVPRGRQELREATLPAYELSSGHSVWGGTNDSPIRGSDPHPQTLAPAPMIAVTRSDGSAMRGIPQPHPGTTTTQVMPVESHRDEHPSILMPLPPFNASTIAAQPLHQMPAAQRASDTGYDISASTPNSDERTPLLANRGPSTAAYDYGNRPAYLGVGYDHSPAPAPQPRLYHLGWLEYHLPDGTFYYVHPTKRVTTDVNLRRDEVLDEVTDLLDQAGSIPNLGHMGEVWLREESVQELKRRKKFLKRRGGPSLAPWEWKYGLWIVDHAARTVVRVDKAALGKGKGRDTGKNKATREEEDQLDMEYRYWSFMESHPAHTTLDNKARSEAVDVLSWALTDRLLPTHRGIPSPFSQDECQELTSLLKSFEATASSDDGGIQTRVIARVLLRVAMWRQVYFRPSKPLPSDVRPVPYRVPGAGSPQGPSVGKTVLDFTLCLLGLGVPFLFWESRSAEDDWERAIRPGTHADAHSAGGIIGELGGTGVFVIGACTWLVAAIVLSTSVTYLSLPEVGGAARAAGMCAVVCASFAMAASMVAFFWYRGEVESTRIGAGRGGVEGVVVGLSKRAVVYSLPLVFLAYSIVACVVGIALYAFRGGMGLGNLISSTMSSSSSGTPVSRLVPVSKSMGEVYGAEMETGRSEPLSFIREAEESVRSGGRGLRWGFLGLLGAAGGALAMGWVVSKNSGVGVMDGGW